MSLIIPPSQSLVASGYDLNYSCRFDKGNTSFLSRTPSSAGNRKTWTWSGWLKLGRLSSQAGSYSMIFGQVTGTPSNGLWISDADKIYIWVEGAEKRVSTLRLRDSSAWYHMVMAVDTTSGTAAHRFRVYINNVEITAWDTDNAITQNVDLGVNASGSLMTIGKRQSEDYYDGLMSEIHFIDGTQLTPSSFGEADETYGHWKPVEVSGLTYGTNGFYLDFADSADLGDDESGNGNDFAETNIAATDQMLDTPTNNFSTLNTNAAALNGTLSKGSLKKTGGSGHNREMSTFSFDSGKWYFEVFVKTYGGNHPAIGVVTTQTGNTRNNVHAGADAGGYGYYGSGGVNHSGSTNGGTYATYTAGDIISVACDMDNLKVYFYKNGSNAITSGTAYETLSANTTYAFACSLYNSGVQIVNFGQDGTFVGEKTAAGNSDGNGYGNFYHAVPSGFLAACTKNLPDPTVVPSEHFNTILYTGTGGARSISGVGFQPDLHWLKIRAGETKSHMITDAVRGAGKYLSSDLNAVENDDIGTVASFDSDGWSFGGATPNQFNYSSRTYVAWNWKANGSGGSNEDGSINTTATSANVAAGFSMSTYTGTGSNATVGHGLSVAPNLVIVKRRTGAVGGWPLSSVQSGASMDFTDAVRLDVTDALFDEASIWNDTAPTASVFSLGTHIDLNASSAPYIVYCFHSVESYSKVGAFEGNANADGSYAYCGFRPAFVMMKNLDAAGQHWLIFDNKRDTYNLSTQRLHPNDSSVEGTDNQIDILSNGFKCRTSNQSSNGAQSILYLAFAETPFKYANAR
tara:strand:+ start:1176 stop:3575 length:2400 start_codon:yes stop_codon:yes gene_type:complete